MKVMMFFCMVRVAVAVAGLAVMAYVALGCTWAAIEETAPIAQSDDGACLRVEWPLIEPGPCSDVGVHHVDDIKYTAPATDNQNQSLGARWWDTDYQIPESEWWWVAPAGAGYTVIRTADFNGLEIRDDALETEPTAGNAIRIAGATGTTLVALSRNQHNELLIWEETPGTNRTLAIYRFVTAPATPE